MTVGAIYGDTTFTSLGAELNNASEYERFPETAGPCYAQSVDVVEIGPEKARVGKRTCFRFELGLGFTQTGYEPPFRRGQKESLEGGVLRFAGKRTEQFEVDNRDFGFEARICKRLNNPGRYKAKLTKPSSGDVFHFSGLTQTVNVRR
jgi:hypothetical protein